MELLFLQRLDVGDGSQLPRDAFTADLLSDNVGTAGF